MKDSTGQQRRGLIPRITYVTPLLFSLALVLAMPSLHSCGKENSPADQNNEIPRYGVVMAESLAVRIDPLPSSAEIENLTQGATVKILRRSSEKVRIGAHEDFWYFVRLDNGIKGWVYGARLNVAGITRAGDFGGDNGNEPDDKTISESGRVLVGKWWEIKGDGSTGYRKFYFWSEGDYEYGYGSKITQDGKYEFLVHKQTVLLNKGSGVGDTLFIRRIGRDLRLYVEHKGRSYSFRKADDNPDSDEVGLDEEILKKRKKRKQEMK